ncbi:zonadhesin [Trichonephila clavipes]|nr:zonadhesin [Trichonephila clavipes]
MNCLDLRDHTIKNPSLTAGGVISAERSDGMFSFLTADTCGEDEEYKDCGSACPPTCWSLDKNLACTQQCVQGCFCRRGLVRNDQGDCVEPKKCPQTSKTSYYSIGEVRRLALAMLNGERKGSDSIKGSTLLVTVNATSSKTRDSTTNLFCR